MAQFLYTELFQWNLDVLKMDWNSDIRVGLFNALKCTKGNYGTHAFMELHTVVYIHSDRSSSVNNETLKKTITAQREHDCLIVFFFFGTFWMRHPWILQRKGEFWRWTLTFQEALYLRHSEAWSRSCTYMIVSILISTHQHQSFVCGRFLDFNLAAKKTELVMLIGLNDLP